MAFDLNDSEDKELNGELEPKDELVDHSDKESNSSTATTTSLVKTRLSLSSSPTTQQPQMKCEVYTFLQSLKTIDSEGNLCDLTQISPVTNCCSKMDEALLGYDCDPITHCCSDSTDCIKYCLEQEDGDELTTSQ